MTWTRSEDMQKYTLMIVYVKTILKAKQPNLELEFEIKLESPSSHKPAFLAIDIVDNSGIVIMQAIPTLEKLITDKDKLHFLRVIIKLPPLIPGPYLTSVWVGSHNSQTIDWVKEVTLFEVNDSPIIGRTYPHTKDHGYIVPISFCQEYNQ